MDAQPGEEAVCSPWALSREAQKGGTAEFSPWESSMEAQQEFQYERARPKSHMRHGTFALVRVGRDLG